MPPGRVLVVGAGPTGLSAALGLAQRGIEAVVVERRMGPSRLSRAVGILPPTLAILEPSGAASAIRAEAVPFSGFVVHTGARELTRILFPPPPDTPVWGLAQDRTEAHLAAAIASAGGGPVRYATPLTALRREGAGVVATLGVVEERFDVAIGADGVHSAVRAALGIPYPGHEAPGTWSIADVEAPGWAEPSLFKGYLLDGGDVAVVAPLSPTRFRVIASRADALAALPVPMPVETLHRADSFVISVRQASRYRGGPVFLAGDAAHCHSPVGGRGMNLGIADADDLARRLAEGSEDGYEAARRPVGERVIRQTEAVRRRVQGGGASRALVLTAVRLVAALPPLRARLVRAIGSV